MAAASSAHRLAHRILVRKLKLVPRSAAARPYAVPGWARAAELRWRLKLRRTPVESGAAYAARSSLADRDEMVTCALCGDDRVQHLFSPTRPGRWTYHVVRCASCGFLYRNPGIKPERLGELYSGGNYGKFLTGRYGRRRKRNYRRIMRDFRPAFADGAGRRVLDYGSGAGLFLEVARKRGFAPTGIDLSPDAVEIARRKGLRSFVGTPMEVPEVAAGGFDVVTMWSVLAHLPRPVDDLRMLRGLLADTGVLLISTVNANSLTLKAYGLGWGGFTPNHLVFFSPTTLPQLLRLAGFAAVVFRPMYAVPPDATPAQERRLRRAVDRGNQGRMLRALAFADPDGPARWGMEGLRLG